MKRLSSLVLTAGRRYATVRFSSISAEQKQFLAEPCILVNNHDRIIGKATKEDCHKWKTIAQGAFLHRAFSVFLFDSKQRLLIQKRADTKPTFPGVWTNTCCSHPLYMEGETDGTIGVTRAAQRKLAQELGYEGEHEILSSELHYLKRYRYKARDHVSWGEHEIDYVLIGRNDKDPPKVNPDEVAAVKWVDQEELQQMLKTEVFSPWFRMIADNALFAWWANLDGDMRQFRDHHDIYLLNWHLGCGLSHFTDSISSSWTEQRWLNKHRKRTFDN